MAKPGRKVSLGEVRRYEQLREAGWSVEAAAEAVGRSRSWGFNREKAKRDAQPKLDDGHPVPSSDLSEAAEMVVALKQAVFFEKDADRMALSKPERNTARRRSEAAHDKVMQMLAKYGDVMLVGIADVAYYLAAAKAGEANNNLKVILAGTPMAAEIEADPIDAYDIIRQIPESLRRARFDGDFDHTTFWWEVPRIQAWMQRLMDLDPDMAAVQEEMRKALDSDDPETAVLELRARVRAGEFLGDDELDEQEV